MGAISAASNHSLKPYSIKIKKGIYLEYIRIKKWKPNIVLLGEGMDKLWWWHQDIRHRVNLYYLITLNSKYIHI